MTKLASSGQCGQAAVVPMPKKSAATMSDARRAELAAINTAVKRRVGAELAAVQVARMIAAPAELAVPLVRRVRGEGGVALTAGVVTQVNAVLAGVGVHALRGRGEFRGRRALVVGSAAVICLAPLLALEEPWVVLDRRSALWGIAVQALSTVPVSLAMAVTVIRVGRAAREEHRGSVLMVE